MYALAPDLSSRLQERLMAELSGSSDGQPVEARLTAALADASAEIDSYLGARFVVPILPAPAVLARIACDIATYRLFEAARDADVKDVRQRYEDALAWLKEAALGKTGFEAKLKAQVAAGSAAADARMVAAIFAGQW